MFLPTFADDAEKERLWQLFLAAERRAKAFPTSADRFVPIQRVDLGDEGAKWLPSGVIELNPGTAPGTLFHEIFHTVFHKTIFHQKSKDEHWGEGWCDAFRFASEHALLGGPETEWSKKIARYTKMSLDEVLAKTNDAKHDRTYEFPASRIVQKTDGTLKGVRALWLKLSADREARGTDILDDFFGFGPQG